MTGTHPASKGGQEKEGCEGQGDPHKPYVQEDKKEKVQEDKKEKAEGSQGDSLS
jgi:hypothetical protein